MKLLVIHPFLFAIFPIIFLFSVNVHSIFPEEIILPLISVIVVTFLIWIALGFLLKSRIKSGFIVSIGLVLYFSYGHIYILLDELQKDTDFSHFVLIIPGLVLFALGSYFFIKTKKSLNNPTKIVNVVAVTLVIISLLGIGEYYITEGYDSTHFLEIKLDYPITSGTTYQIIVTGQILHGTNANPEDVLSPDGTTVNGGIFPGGRDDFYFTGDIVSITAETQPILTFVDGVKETIDPPHFLEIKLDPSITSGTTYQIIVTGQILHGTTANPDDVLSPDGTTVNGGIFPGGIDNFYFTGDIVSITAETQPILTIVDGVETPTVYNEKDVEPIKQQVHTSETKKLPDVYYIIPDAYSGSKSLQTILNYDNSEFTDFLKNKGFYIPTESFANYRMTQLSIPSTLTMKYLNYLSEIKGINSTYPKELVEITRHNEVIKNFKSLGYTTYAIEAGSMHTNKMENIDFRLCATKNVSEFGPMLIRTTILNPVQVHLFANEYRENILCGFSELTKMAENNESPKFVIAHLMIPHRPDVFGPNGEPILARLLILEDVDKYWNSELYLGQLKFTNLKLTEIISKLTDTNDPPIIIIQSDHGMRGLQMQDKYEYELMLRDFNIFKAYYFPGIGQNIEFEKTTSVNSFRVLFNLYFGYEYDLLEDKIYFSPWNKLYEFTDITEILIKNNTAI